LQIYLYACLFSAKCLSAYLPGCLSACLLSFFCSSDRPPGQRPGTGSGRAACLLAFLASSEFRSSTGPAARNRKWTVDGSRPHGDSSRRPECRTTRGWGQQWQRRASAKLSGGRRQILLLKNHDKLSGRFCETERRPAAKAAKLTCLNPSKAQTQASNAVS
jgi:hypothetical protein